MVDYTGLPFDFIDRHNLRVSVYNFADEILKDQKSMVSIYDSRVIGYGGFDINNDPILAVISGGPFISTMNDYLQTQLNFKTDHTYIPLNEEAHALWNWIDKEQGDMGFPNTGFSLSNALKRTGSLRIFVASGLYDLVTPYDNTVHLINHFDLPRNCLKNISFFTYEGGHMMYLNSEAHKKFKEGLIKFYEPLQ